MTNKYRRKGPIADRERHRVDSSTDTTKPERHHRAGTRSDGMSNRSPDEPLASNEGSSRNNKEL